MATLLIKQHVHASMFFHDLPLPMIKKNLLPSKDLKKLPGSQEARGFTLIELMVTLAIAAILAAIALPSYRQYIIRSNRTAAQTQMMDIANREEQFLLANRVYANKTTLQANGYALPSEIGTNYDYDITLGLGAVPAYTITFTAKSAQITDGDLSLTHTGVKSPSGKW